MGKHIGEFEQLILFAVVRLRGDAYTSAIQTEIEDTTGRSRSVGSIHTTLERLEARGCLTSVFAEGTPARGGRRRRVYAMTPEGARLLQTAHEHLTRMADGVLGEIERLAARRQG